VQLSETSPMHCPKGHTLAGNVVVGWLPCSCAGGRGHRSWQCQRCQATTYEPPHVDGREVR